MPTARPIIIARVEVVVPRSSTFASAVIVETPMPTPMSAVSSGSPAAISEPKVMTRTTAAIAIPMISVAPGLRHRLERVTADLDGQPALLRRLAGVLRASSRVASVSSIELTL